MISDEQKKLITDLWDQELICVVSVLDSIGSPQSAAVAFTGFEDLTITFQTPNSTRKYKNLKDNPKISVVIGWNIAEMKTIQYEGEAFEIENEEEINRVRKSQLQKNPNSEKYAYLEENRYFLIKPKWIRYSDLKAQPNLIFEHKFE